MEIEQNTQYKSGFAAIVGKPNVGKSSLLNILLNQKVAAVTPRPQTTRKNQLGILTTIHKDIHVQIIFIDTPGVHRPRYKLGEYMVQEATKSLQECDVVLFMVDGSQPPSDEDHQLAGIIRETKRSVPGVLVINKKDLCNAEQLDNHIEEYTSLAPLMEPIAISITRQENLDTLMDKLVEMLPDAPPYFPADQVTDLFERDLSADIIRESALNLLRDEIPHGIVIRIDQFIERNEQGAYIEATLFVEKESHKAIVIGQKGSMLKQIGSMARKEIEAMSGRKVYLRIRVKVRKNWRNDERVLRKFGY
ncbi:MAG: GTPase Era [Anaerolineales bacterium]|nr:GTPase Era [Anaerolineales bacterium]